MLGHHLHEARGESELMAPKAVGKRSSAPS